MGITLAHDRLNRYAMLATAFAPNPGLRAKTLETLEPGRSATEDANSDAVIMPEKSKQSVTTALAGGPRSPSKAGTCRLPPLPLSRTRTKGGSMRRKPSHAVEALLCTRRSAAGEPGRAWQHRAGPAAEAGQPHDVQGVQTHVDGRRHPAARHAGPGRVPGGAQGDLLHCLPRRFMSAVSKLMAAAMETPVNDCNAQLRDLVLIAVCTADNGMAAAQTQHFSRMKSTGKHRPSP